MSFTKYSRSDGDVPGGKPNEINKDLLQKSLYAFSKTWRFAVFVKREGVTPSTH